MAGISRESVTVVVATALAGATTATVAALCFLHRGPENRLPQHVSPPPDTLSAMTFNIRVDTEKDKSRTGR
eukprot:SAG31_NODE_19883_length_589_cov_1.038776_1_plen_71_part_00